jgi:hypothetical protein
MFYLTFLVPEATKLLEANGFDVELPNVQFDWPWKGLVLVNATRKA